MGFLNKLDRNQTGVASIELTAILFIALTCVSAMGRASDRLAFDSYGEVALSLAGGTKGGFGGK